MCALCQVSHVVIISEFSVVMDELFVRINRPFRSGPLSVQSLTDNELMSIEPEPRPHGDRFLITILPLGVERHGGAAQLIFICDAVLQHVGPASFSRLSSLFDIIHSTTPTILRQRGTMTNIRKVLPEPSSTVMSYILPHFSKLRQARPVRVFTEPLPTNREIIVPQIFDP